MYDIFASHFGTTLEARSMLEAKTQTSCGYTAVCGSSS